MRISSMKLKVVGAITISLALSLSACSGNNASSDDGPTHIIFSYLWGGKEGEVLQGIIDQYNASQDEIFVEGVSSPDVQKQLTQMSSAKASFDISDNFSANTASLAAKGALTPLDGFIARDGYVTSDFVPAAFEQGVYNGQTYAIPIMTMTDMVFYNKALFAEAGISDPPVTFEDWAEIIPKLTKTDAGGNLTQLGFGIVDSSKALTNLANAFGGGFNGVNSGGPQPDTPQNRAALDFYWNNVIEPNGVDNVMTFYSGFGELFSPEWPFYTGQLATYIDSPNQVVNILDLAPGLDYGVTNLPYPAAQPELAEAAIVRASTMFIPANTEKKEEAWEFMKYLLSPDIMAQFSRGITNLPARTSLIDSPVYNDLPDTYRQFLQTLSNTNAVPSATPVPWQSEWVADRQTVFDNAKSGLSTPAEAITKLASDASRYG